MDIQSLNASQLREQLRERAISQGTNRTSATTAQGGAVGRSVDDVELSTAAQTLRQASSDTRAPFDQARVESIRSAIAEGRYHVDPERLASNFMRIEYDIFQ